MDDMDMQIDTTTDLNSLIVALALHGLCLIIWFWPSVKFPFEFQTLAFKKKTQVFGHFFDIQMAIYGGSGANLGFWVCRRCWWRRYFLWNWWRFRFWGSHLLSRRFWWFFFFFLCFFPFFCCFLFLFFFFGGKDWLFFRLLVFGFALNQY